MKMMLYFIFLAETQKLCDQLGQILHIFLLTSHTNPTELAISTYAVNRKYPESIYTYTTPHTALLVSVVVLN